MKIIVCTAHLDIRVYSETSRTAKWGMEGEGVQIENPCTLTVAIWIPDTTHHNIVILVGGQAEDSGALISEGCDDASCNLAYPGEGAERSNLNDQGSPFGLFHLNGVLRIYD